MKRLVLLLFLIAQDVRAQQSEPCASSILNKLDGDFFAALRKEESEGDICKRSANKLGPYQISEEYYEDAVETNQELKTGGMSV